MYAKAGSVDAAFNLGILHDSRGEHDEAERLFQQAARGGEARARARLRMARTGEISEPIDPRYERVHNPAGDHLD